VAANRATGGPLQVNVRAAKDRLSELLEVASRGDEVVITSDGKPKARLVPATRASKPFEVDWEWLKSMPIRSGKTAEEVVREDRNGRF
jgi:prevent-host-death family protein